MKPLTLGQRLKMARQTTDYTQEQVAELLEVHHFTYSKWEQDLHPPSKKRYFDDLARLYNCSLGWLRDGSGEMGSYVPEPKPDSENRRIISRTPHVRPELGSNTSGLTAAQQIVLQTVTQDILTLPDDQLLSWHARYQTNMAAPERSRSILPANQDLPGRTLGEKIRKAREAAGYSIPALCRSLLSFAPSADKSYETDPHYIEAIEADREVPEPSMLLRLGTLYRVNWLLFTPVERSESHVRVDRNLDSN